MIKYYRHISRHLMHSLGIVTLLLVVAFGVGIVSHLARYQDQALAVSSSWTFDSGASYSFESALIKVETSLAQVKPTWWDANYADRAVLKLMNTSNESLAAGVPVTVTLDTSALPSVRQDCADVRVVYFDGSTSSELSRFVAPDVEASGCDDATAARITFQLQAALAGQGSAYGYLLYSGYASASVPATPEQSFDLGSKAALHVDLIGDLVSADGETPTSAGALRYSGVSSALSFGGAGDYVRFGDFAALDLPDAFTLESWILPYAFGGEDRYLIYRAGSYYLRVNTSGKLVAGIYNGSTWTTATSTATVSISAYTHVAMTFDRLLSSNQLKLYLNGTQDGTGTQTAAIPAQTAALHLGGDGSSNSFQGLLDEVRLSSTTRYHGAFTASDVPWVADEYTVLLIHTDRDGAVSGSENEIGDSGPYAQTGTNVGAGFAGGLVGVDPSGATGKALSGVHGGHAGVLIERSSTNLVPNPSFENASYLLRYTSSGLTTTSQTGLDKVRYGATSVKVVNASASENGTLVTAVDPDATEVSFGIYAFNANDPGAAVTSSELVLSYDGSEITSPAPVYQDMGDGWWRVSVAGLPVADASKNYGVIVKPETALYLDGWQLEAQNQPTSYLDGSLGSGYSWAGTTHDSASNRTGASVSYLLADHLDATAGTVALWVRPLWVGADSLEHVFWEAQTTAGELKLYKNTSNSLILTDGTHEASKDISTWDPNVWHHVAASWKSGEMQVYVDGTAGTANNTFTAPTLSTNWYLGSDTSAANVADAVLGQVTIFDDALSSAEIVDLLATWSVNRTSFPLVIQNNSIHPYFTKLTGFAQTLGSGHDGSIGYQLSPDGSNWFYSDGANWKRVRSVTDNSTAAQMSSTIADFVSVAGRGQFYFRSLLAGTSPRLDALEINYQNAPSAPTSLYANNTTAASGAIEPSDLTDTTPAFSAVYEDHDDSDQADLSRIQVSTDSTFASITHWDSGAAGTAITAVTEGNRAQDLVYGSFGTAPLQSLAVGDGAVDYYFRIKFWDLDDNEGDWSAASHFAMQDSPAAPSALAVDTVTYNQITIVWQDNSTGQSQEEGFEIHTSTDGIDYALLHTTTTDETAYTHNTLLPDSVHYYKVRAVNTAGSSAYTSAIEAHTAAKVPLAPMVNNVDYGQIRLLIDTNANPDSVEYAIAVSEDDFATDTRYVQSDNTLGATLGSEDWRTFDGFGGSSGVTVSGFDDGVRYDFKGKARNQADAETAYSTAAELTSWNRPSLTLSIEGTTLGDIDLTGQSGSVPFTQIQPNQSKTAVLQVSVNTNATSGYTVYMSADDKMKHTRLTDVDVDFVKNLSVGTNGAPVAWASPAGVTIGEDTAYLGYHTSDALLGSGNATRFAAANTWAGFDDLGKFYEILYNANPSSGLDDGEEFVYLTFKFESNNLHPSGNYTNLQLKYKVVPVF